MLKNLGDEEQREQDKEDRKTMELEYDGSWGEHQCVVERCEWCGYLICRCD